MDTLQPIFLNLNVYNKCIVSDLRYKQAVEQTASFNHALSQECNMRMPFLDGQTGVAQNHTSLFQNHIHRGPGSSKQQLYTYPAKRWKKTKFLFVQLEGGRAKENIDTSTCIETGEADIHAISAMENPAVQCEDDDHSDMKSEASKDRWYDEFDDLVEPLDAGEIDDRQSIDSDYEETYTKKRKKKTPVSGRGRKKKEDRESSVGDDKDKPFSCEVCGARYKTRPGLAYHYAHFHTNAVESDDSSTTPTKPIRPERAAKTAAAIAAAESKMTPNNYCDFCLGDASENKKTRMSEDLVSCSDCGRSGHPSCLQFTNNMIVSVKKYPWQCIECKSCGLCGTSDNDDQLLFCDDCDRGYHMYCLNPPLEEPPEGSWSCHLCIEEFHDGKKPEGMN